MVMGDIVCLSQHLLMSVLCFIPMYITRGQYYLLCLSISQEQIYQRVSLSPYEIKCYFQEFFIF